MNQTCIGQVGCVQDSGTQRKKLITRREAVDQFGKKQIQSPVLPTQGSGTEVLAMRHSVMEKQNATAHQLSLLPHCPELDGVGKFLMEGFDLDQAMYRFGSMPLGQIWHQDFFPEAAQILTTAHSQTLGQGFSHSPSLAPIPDLAWQRNRVKHLAFGGEAPQTCGGMPPTGQMFG